MTNISKNQDENSHDTSKNCIDETIPEGSALNHFNKNNLMKDAKYIPLVTKYNSDLIYRRKTIKRSLPLWIVLPFFMVGIIMFLSSIIMEHYFSIQNIGTQFLKEIGIVFLVIIVIHEIYELIIHRALQGDILSLRENVEKLQKTVSIVGGAIESGLAAVYSSREDANRAIMEEMENMPKDSRLRLLGISLGAFLCPHGSMHGAFRKLLQRGDVTIQAIILNKDCEEAINRAKLEEPRSFFNQKSEDQIKKAYETTRCHNELKTATDFADDLSKRCYYRPNSPMVEDAPNEPPVNANFSYKMFDIAPLCYLVIFQDYMFLESYHYAGRGGESPVLKIAQKSGQFPEVTSLFRIYENHYCVMEKNSISK